MHTRFTQALFIVLFAELIFVPSSEAASVRVSFLNDASSLRETIGMLTNNGSDPEGTAIFQRIVESYFTEGFSLDRSKFPELKDGFYNFSSMSNLVQALPHRLCDSDHVWDFNCFDAPILLAGDQLHIGLRPDEYFGPFMVSEWLTNGEERVVVAATARDAYSRVYAQWYREITDSYLPKSNRDNRIGLTAEFFRWHPLPMSATNRTVEKETWDILRSDWKRAGIKFPEKFEILLYHKSDLRMQTICTAHAGILFRHEQGYVYLEKSGGRGPFVRLDIAEKADLLPWFDENYNDQEHKYASLFVTFNDTDIVYVNGKPSSSAH